MALEWELRRQDAKLEGGDELSGHAYRARLAAETRLRLDLLALDARASLPHQAKARAAKLAEL